MDEQTRRLDGAISQGDPATTVGTAWGDEGAPEGYYDGDDDSYIPDEDDPDYDLSEVHGYSYWEPARAELIPRWVIVTASILLIVAILIPLLIRIS
jgi:hypothetical protein